MALHYTTFTSTATNDTYTEKRIGRYRWRKNFLFGKTLEEAWMQTDTTSGSAFLIWKKVKSVDWNADSITDTNGS